MTRVEGWPGLISTEMASRYLSLEEATFFELAARFGVLAVETGDGVLKWRRQDLDRLIRKLPSLTATPIKPQTTHLLRLEDSHIVAIADAVVERLSRRPSLSDRKLVSIGEATTLLGLGRTTVYRMIGEGRLTAAKIGRRTLIHLDTINSIIDDT